MTELKVLIATRELLSDPARWTQGAMARDENGERVEANDPSAVCWCLNGAVRKVIRLSTLAADQSGGGRLAWHRINAAANQAPFALNDNSAHEAVLAVLDLAIDAAAEAAVVRAKGRLSQAGELGG